MSACEKYEELLQQYLDKALDGAQTAVLMSHLDSCTQCRRDFKLYQKVVEGLEHLEELAPPGRLTNDVMAQLDGMPNGNPIGSFIAVGQPAPWLWGLSAAAAAAVAVAAFFVFHPAGPANLPAPVMVAQPDVPVAPAIPLPVLEEPSQAPGTSGPHIMLTVASGAVEVQKVNSSRWEAVANATEVGYGDKIRTMNGASAHIEYTQDKTTLKLRPSSLVQILASSVRVYHGDTWIRVDKIGSHFQAETPNAVASVRGTRFSAEVHYPEKIAKLYEGDLSQGTVVHKFLDEYRKTLTSDRMNGLLPLLAYPMQATPVSLAVQVSMLIDTATAAREAQSNVEVFQGKVNVASLDSEGHEISSVLVKEGHKTSVEHMQLAKLTPLKEDDFVKWNLPVNRQLLDAVASEAVAEVSEMGAAARPAAAAGALAPVPAVATDGPNIEAGDRPSVSYDGVEKRH